MVGAVWHSTWRGSFLQHDPEAISAVLHIFLRVIEARLRQGSGCARGRLGAVSFVQRFGSTLNAHVHLHCCVIDGVFVAGADGQVQFAEAPALTPEDLAGRCVDACCVGSRVPAISMLWMRAT